MLEKKIGQSLEPYFVPLILLPLLLVCSFHPRKIRLVYSEASFVNFYASTAAGLIESDFLRTTTIFKIQKKLHRGAL